MVDKNAIAVARRAALRRAMDAHGMNPTDLARACGFPSPNAIYNFLNGRTQSLDFTTLQQIVKAMPGTTMEQLTGQKPKAASSPVMIRTACQAGALRDQFSLPASQIDELPLPVEDSARQAGAFGAIVKQPGAEEIFPEKTILLCVPAERYEGKLVKGMRFIVERFSGTRMEVTVREAFQDSDERFWLSQRSTEPRLAAAIKMPSRIDSRVWQHDGEKYALAAVVIGAFVPQVGAP